MYSITDLKTGVTINLDGAPYEVVKYQHSKMGRGGAVLRATLKNLLSGNNVEKTFHGEEKFVPADLQSRKSQYLYRDGADFVFMDLETFEQFHIPSSTVGFASNFLMDGQEVTLLTFEGRPINLRLPTKMTFKVAEADPAVKGDTANNPSKTIKLETGLELKAPMFVNQGDSIIVDTRDGTYIERAK